MSQCAKYVDCPVTPVLTDYSATSPNSASAPSIIQNGGFETGAFAPWILTGTAAVLANSVVTNDPPYVYSGTWAAALNSVNNTDLGQLTQTVQTVMGEQYLLTFQLKALGPVTGAINQMSALWNGQAVVSVTNLPLTQPSSPASQGWLYCSAVVTAVSAVSTLQFVFQSGAAYGFALDVISLTPNYKVLPVFIGLGFGPNTPPPLGWEFDIASGFSVQTSTLSQAAADAAAYSAAVFEAQQNWVPPGGLQPIEWGDYPSDFGEPGSVTEMPLT